MYASPHPNGSIKQPKLVVDMTHGTLRSLMPEYLTNKSVNGIWNEFGFQGVSVPEVILHLGYVKLMSLWCLRKQPTHLDPLLPRAIFTLLFALAGAPLQQHTVDFCVGTSG